MKITFALLFGYPKAGVPHGAGRPYDTRRRVGAQTCCALSYSSSR